VARLFAGPGDRPAAGLSLPTRQWHRGQGHGAQQVLAAATPVPRKVHLRLISGERITTAGALGGPVPLLVDAVVGPAEWAPQGACLGPRPAWSERGNNRRGQTGLWKQDFPYGATQSARPSGRFLPSSRFPFAGVRSPRIRSRSAGFVPFPRAPGLGSCPELPSGIAVSNPGKEIDPPARRSGLPSSVQASNPRGFHVLRGRCAILETRVVQLASESLNIFWRNRRLDRIAEPATMPGR